MEYRTRKLETVYLDFCENLRSVHPSILSHTLVNLDVSYCSNLESLESEAHLKSLSDLRVDNCGSLKKFCLSMEKVVRLDLFSSKVEILHLPTFGQLAQLRDLCLNGSRLRSLPINELRCFTNLERFRLEDFHQVIHKTELEILFAAWRRIRRLFLDKCSKWSEIPENISTLTELESLSFAGSGVEILPASMQQVPNLRHISLIDCGKLRSILGLPLTLDRLEATDCTSLETIFWPSRFQHEFLDHIYLLDFKNCAKLDKPSLTFGEKLIQSSIISAVEKGCYYTACYPGNRVPNWMMHKQVASAATNTVEFTCDDEQSLIGIVFCCVLPSNPMVMTICCNYSDDNNIEFMSQYLNDSYPPGGYDMDHVCIWYQKFTQSVARASNHGRIACGFFATDGVDNIESIDFEVSIKACGVCPIYASQSKRKRDAHFDDIACKKQK